MKIAILGAGNMGLAFARSFLKYDLLSPENLHLIARDAAHATTLQESFSRSIITTLEATHTLETDVLILAVKPQDFAALAKYLPFRIPDSCLVLSIMAGITIAKLQKLLHHDAIIRAMPNAPSVLGMGITGYTAAPAVPWKKTLQVERLLNTTGRAVFLEEEHLLDSVTALSGSGPAYFYYIVKAMVQAGVQMGLEEHLAQLFVKQTLLGAYHLMNEGNENLDDLIAAVASKGGTTEAALRTFEKHGLSEILQQGILAAEQRAKELNQY